MQDSNHRGATRRNVLKGIGTVSVLGLGGIGLTETASAHVQDPHADRWIAADSSNYTNASRGSGSIDWVIVHVTEGSYSGTVSWFQNPNSDVSTHYVIRNSDGHATQMVHYQDIGWHAGNWDYNQQSIGIEHEGYTDQTNFTNALYQKSADITRWYCDHYSITKQHPTGSLPSDASGSGIVGHDQIPGSTHTDPGTTWDWDYYMDLINGGSGGDHTILFQGRNANGKKSYGFRATGQINRAGSAESDDTISQLSGGDYTAEGTVTDEYEDKFWYDGSLAYFTTPDFFVDIDSGKIRIKGRGSGQKSYGFRATGDVDRLSTAESNDTITNRSDGSCDVEGQLTDEKWDEFAYNGVIAFVTTTEFFVDIDR